MAGTRSSSRIWCGGGRHRCRRSGRPRGRARAGETRRRDRRRGRPVAGRDGARARGIRNERRAGRKRQSNGRRESGTLMHKLLWGSVIVFAAAVVARPARAQETASDTLLTVDHYLDWEQVADPQLSPDGSQVVYTRRWVNKIDDKWESALW